jgi:hypothetical protein
MLPAVTACSVPLRVFGRPNVDSRWLCPPFASPVMRLRAPPVVPRIRPGDTGLDLEDQSCFYRPCANTTCFHRSERLVPIGPAPSALCLRSRRRVSGRHWHPGVAHQEPSFRHAFTHSGCGLDPSPFLAFRQGFLGHMPPIDFCSCQIQQHPAELPRPCRFFAVASYRASGNHASFEPSPAEFSLARGLVEHRCSTFLRPPLLRPLAAVDLP